MPDQTEPDQTEPDYRFTLAAERTYLAYVRTSLALIASGVAVVAVLTGTAEPLRRILATLLVLAGLAVAVGGRHRWTQVDEAIRRGEPLPRSLLGNWLALLMVGVAAVGILLVFVF